MYKQLKQKKKSVWLEMIRHEYYRKPQLIQIFTSFIFILVSTLYILCSKSFNCNNHKWMMGQYSVLGIVMASAIGKIIYLQWALNFGDQFFQKILYCNMVIILGYLLSIVMDAILLFLDTECTLYNLNDALRPALVFEYAAIIIKTVAVFFGLVELVHEKYNCLDYQKFIQTNREYCTQKISDMSKFIDLYDGVLPEEFINNGKREHFRSANLWVQLSIFFQKEFQNIISDYNEDTIQTRTSNLIRFDYTYCEDLSKFYRITFNDEDPINDEKTSLLKKSGSSGPLAFKDFRSIATMSLKDSK